MVASAAQPSLNADLLSRNNQYFLIFQENQKACTGWSAMQVNDDYDVRYEWTGKDQVQDMCVCVCVCGLSEIEKCIIIKNDKLFNFD